MRETTDLAEICRVAFHPDVRAGILGEVPEGWIPPIKEGVHYLIEGDVLVIFVRLKADVYESHVGVIPGGRAKKSAIRAIQWLRDNTPCRLLIGYIPKNNLAALVNAKAVGMRQFSRFADTVMVGMEL